MRVFRVVFLAVLTFSVLAIAIFVFAIAVHQNPSTVARNVTVTGTGTTTVVPDAVRLDATITSIAGTSASALSNISKSAQTFRYTLTSAGVLTKYIQTQTLTVNPNYTYSQNGGSKISGYQASQQFTIVIRNAKNAGAIVSAAQNAVGNSLQVGGVSPYIFDESSAEASARAQAITLAKAKALSYATLTGAKLGKILAIDETIQNSPQPIIAMSVARDALTPKAAQIDLGQQDVTVTVTTEWSIS